MSDQQVTSDTKLVATVRELLNEEKWTRAALNNYTVNNFRELDDVLTKVLEEDLEDEVSEICEEHLQHTKNSIIALYLAGILRLSRQAVDDGNLVMLINIFSDNHKWGIVEYLAQRILEYGENKYALRTLADCYNSENQYDKMYDVWERLIRVDFEEADIVRHLADQREKQEKLDEAVDYYKKALHRYINKKNFNNVKEVWHKLIQFAPEDREFFYHAEGKIAKMVSPDRAIQLLEDLYPHYKKNGEWDTAIEILKRVLTYDSKNPWGRKEIIECYQAKYADHSHLDEYIKISNLNQSWRNVHDAISDFEKHIAFDAGNFVFHRAWGVGIIRDLDDDSITIDFVKKRGHKMSLKMAVSALDILSKDHIWVLRSISKKEKLRKKVKSDIVWALKTVIRSLDNSADMKKIKGELVPYVLTQSEWSTWSTKARQILKTNQDFGVVTDKLDHFVVRDQPISFAEKTFNRFKAERTFFDRVKTMYEFLEYIEESDEEQMDSDLFREMFDYFAGFLRSQNVVNEQVVGSNLLVRRIVESHPYLNPGLDLEFAPFFDSISNLEETFDRLDNNDLRREFTRQVRKNTKEWPDIFVRLLPYYLSRDIVTELERSGKEHKLRQLFQEIYNSYRDLREPFVWIARNCIDDEWIKESDVDYERILIAMIHLLDITAREIDNRKDATFNRKINRQIHSFLFKDGRLNDFVEQADEDSLNRVFTLVGDVKDLDPSLVIDLKQRILNRFPDFHFYGEVGKETVSRGFIVTQESYNQKQQALQHLHDVEVPANSKEIAEAAAHGDLRENAEYKAAKERQDMLNNTAARLKQELEKAQIMRQRDVDSSKITFGTTVRLLNRESNEVEQYDVLGPWESDPNNRIISYLSPLGAELANHVPGDELEFVINDREYRYRVEEVVVASF